MAPPAAVFINTAFAGRGAYSLSYTHHGVKWLVRSHLLSLFHEFRSLLPRASQFTDDDGNTFYLLCAEGTINCVSITIWLPPTYPFRPPLVFSPILSTVQHNHPFVKRSTGAVLTPYLLSWCHPKGNLLDLARNLRHIFRLHSPLSPSPTAVSVNGDLYHVSKQEAIDRLALALFHDFSTFRQQVDAQMDELGSHYNLLRHRGVLLSDAVLELEDERNLMMERVMTTESNVAELQGWLKESGNMVEVQDCAVEQTFNCADDLSSVLLVNSSEDLAIEDALQKLDRYLQDGVVELGAYMKHVRNFAREQFYCRQKIDDVRNWASNSSSR